MIRGLRFAAAAMSAEQTRQDAIAHNLANADTAGFRRVMVSIQEGQVMALSRRDVAGPALGALGTGPHSPRLVLDLRPGSLATTGDPHDIGIDGPGFVAVSGGRMARSGRLGADPEGFLTISGIRAEGLGGPIRVGRDRIELQPDGTVQADGSAAGRLRIVTVEPGRLEQAGAGFYRASDPAVLRDGGGTLRQGVRERSSVNPIEELVQMVAGLRAYEAAQRVMQASDDTLAQAAGQVARIG